MQKYTGCYSSGVSKICKRRNCTFMDLYQPSTFHLVTLLALELHNKTFLTVLYVLVHIKETNLVEISF